MSRRAELAVHLVGHSFFDSPADENGDAILEGAYSRFSMHGHSDEVGYIQTIPEFAGRACYQSFDRPSPKTATNQDYLANILRQRHFSVLEHASVTFYITGVSRALTHELVRHRHFSPSQLSQRYVPIEDLKIVIHPTIRDAIELMTRKNVALSEEAKEHPKLAGVFESDIQEAIRNNLDAYANKAAQDATNAYGKAMDFVAALFPHLKRKQLQEAARMKLPNEVETRIVVTGNFRTWMEFLLKRDSGAADEEIQQLAGELGARLAGIAPNVFGAEARSLWDDTHSQEAPKT